MKSKLLLCILCFLFLIPSFAHESTAGSTSAVLNVPPISKGEITSEAASIDVYSTTSIKAFILDSFVDVPVMASIASCESRYRQFNADGSVHRGVANTHDIGLFQINETYWREESLKMGYDIYTLDGNIGFAKVLYGRNGTRDWNWSKYPIGNFQGWAQGECTR